MPKRSPLPVVGAVVVGALALVVGGTAVGIGPLAATTPPSEVTDPKEMVARSLQAVLDAQAVHLEGTLAGTIPGSLVQRDEAGDRAGAGEVGDGVDDRPPVAEVGQGARSTCRSPPAGR